MHHPDQMQAHLEELEILVGRRPLPEELLPREQVEHLREEIVRREYVPSVVWKLKFGDPRVEQLARILKNANGSKVYVWTPASNTCGLHPPIALASFNFDFPFDVNSEGIISLVTSDLSDRLIFDFSDENTSRLIEIEAMGPHWGAIGERPVAVEEIHEQPDPG